MVKWKSKATVHLNGRAACRGSVDALSCNRCSVEGAVVRSAAPYAKLASANYASSGVVDVAAAAAVGAYSSRSLPAVAMRDDRYRPANSAYAVGGGRF